MTLKNLGYATLTALTAAAFVIGAAGSGEAKAKKKMAAPPPPPVICTMEYKQVCGSKGGMKVTYANACFAAKDGAKVVSQGACKPPKAHKKAAKKMAKPAKKEMKKK